MRGHLDTLIHFRGSHAATAELSRPAFEGEVTAEAGLTRLARLLVIHTSGVYPLSYPLSLLCGAAAEVSVLLAARPQLCLGQLCHLRHLILQVDRFAGIWQLAGSAKLLI